MERTGPPSRAEQPGGRPRSHRVAGSLREAARPAGTRRPGGEPFGEGPHAPTGATSTSAPHPGQDIEAGDARPAAGARQARRLAAPRGQSIGMSSTRVSRGRRSRRSRYQSISERSVSSASRIRVVMRSCSSAGAARRTASSRTNSAEKSSPPPAGGGGGAPRSGPGSGVEVVLVGGGGGGGGEPGGCALRGARPSGSPGRAPQVVFSADPPSRCPLERDLQRAVGEARAARVVGRQRGRQHDSPLLGAHPDHHLEPDLAQLHLALLGERQRQAQQWRGRCPPTAPGRGRRAARPRRRGRRRSPRPARPAPPVRSPRAGSGGR